ncbi:MAG: aminotransferase [Pseudomonadales bacterium]|uniref:DegT/DnrJ/EryC1/StrS family aminotransferase n=1 Tax=unclassified Ketobacter TaxID=2639109 RepID=UPI000C92E2E2|nr:MULTISPECIES: DegT/DnrJ/EryC1/StrS aminotransferase family protein [unclassified Ketobacter]MAQ24174.1 aminotransferase [Pseudomonadales bacterium]RLT87610.1 MAG: DegT/DnrJ/EryC1/StrS aminotransferase family protein [Ketobacter sp. GenoA1]RLT92939.1 MAG: DegT/DnrJ/EryC1/StrS aminotransferase family protein [Ketobacter sp.]|tara:strand:+ start:4482 stop:5666 length:1185 start_codon:yes stop_codon:yes gene_type:complete
MSYRPFSPWPCFTQEEADAVTKVLLSNNVNYWTGSECTNFETEFACHTGSKFAITLANGTVALELALRGLEIGVGDHVIVTPRTFIASASSISAVGAVPIFADIDPDTQNISADTIRVALTPQTKAIICVHLAGMPCDMDPIVQLAKEHNLYVVEDCAQAHGATYKGRSVGSIGDVGAWSFCQDKIMSTGGEGGMVTTSNADLHARMWGYKDHGKDWDVIHSNSNKSGSSFRWVHNSLGTNWRMTEMQAAIGRIQLRRLPEWVEKRKANAQRIWREAIRIPGLNPSEVPEWAGHAAYKCYVFVNPDALKPDWCRDKIINSINDLGVPCFSGSCPEVYLEKAFEKSNLRPSSRLQNAKTLGETSLMFLVHPTLTESEIDATCEAMEKVMSQATLS